MHRMSFTDGELTAAAEALRDALAADLLMSDTRQQAGAAPDDEEARVREPDGRSHDRDRHRLVWLSTSGGPHGRAAHSRRARCRAPRGRAANRRSTAVPRACSQPFRRRSSAHDLLAVAAEHGDSAVAELRDVLASYEAMHATDLSGPSITRVPRRTRHVGRRAEATAVCSGMLIRHGDQSADSAYRRAGHRTGCRGCRRVRRRLTRGNGAGRRGPPRPPAAYGWLARIACTSAPSLTVDVKKLITSLPAIVSRPM